MTSTATDTQLKSAAGATFLVFGINGLVFASWAARIPAVTEILDITSGQMGTLLLCLAVGSLIALPTAGFVVGRIGTANTVRSAGLFAAAAGVGVALSLMAASVPGTAGFAVFLRDRGRTVGCFAERRRRRRRTPARAHGHAAVPRGLQRWRVRGRPDRGRAVDPGGGASGAPAGRCRRRRRADDGGPAVLPAASGRRRGPAPEKRTAARADRPGGMAAPC